MLHLLKSLILLWVCHLTVAAATPTISAPSRTADSVLGGAQVTISGTYLLDGTNTEQVLFGAKPATVLSRVNGSPQRITVVVPAQGVGPQSIYVKNGYGTGSWYAFQYINSYAPVFASQPSSVMQIDGGVPAFSTGTSEALAVVGKTYTYRVVLAGCPTPTFALISGPAGMTWVPDPLSGTGLSITGQLTWTPSAAGVTPVTIRVTNSAGSKDQSFSLRVIPALGSLQVDGKSITDPQHPLKVMCMGDSITLGVNAQRYGQFVGSYRGKLLGLLQDAGYSNVQMVGGLNTYNPNGRTDLNHEGNGGFRSYQLTSLVQGNGGRTSPLILYQPDIVVLMVGVLDVTNYNGSNNNGYYSISDFSQLSSSRMKTLIEAIQFPSNNGNYVPRVVVLPMLHSSYAYGGIPKNIWNASQDAWNLGNSILMNGLIVARTQAGTANVVTNNQQSGNRISFSDANRTAIFGDYQFNALDPAAAGGMLDSANTHPTADAHQNAVVQAAFRAILDATPGALPHNVPPSPPSGLTAVINASVPNVTALNVAWTVNSRNEDNFDVDWSPNADFSSAVTTTFAAGTSATTLSGLPSGAIIYLRVRARNAGGASWYCPPIQAITANGPPTIVTISTGTVNQLTVTSGTQNLASTTFVGGGTLQKTGAGTVQWGPGIATFAMDAGALIDVQGGTLIGGSYGNDVWSSNLADLNVAAGAVFDGGDAAVRVDALTGAGTIKFGPNAVFGVDNGNGTFSGILANSTTSAGFLKVGTGTQALSGANTYTGGTTIRTGTLIAASNGAFGSGAVTLVDSQSGSSDSVALMTSGAVTIANPINFYIYSDISGVTTIGGTTADSSVFSGLFHLDKNTLITAASGGTVTISGAISPQYSAGGGLTKIGAGTVVLTGANTCAGPIAISQGTLTLGGAGSIAKTASLSIAAGTIFDVSAIASYTVGSSTSLYASGVGTIVGTTAATIMGSSINLGAQPVNLTFTPTAFTGDATHPALYVQAGTLSLNNNPFTIINASTAPLDVGTYAVIQQANGGVAGSVSGSTVAVTGMGLVAGATASMSIAAGTVNLVVTITQAPQTITFPAIGDQIYGVAPLTLSATATSNLTPVFSVVSGPAMVSGTTLTITGAGTVVVAADQAGNANYLAATQVTQSITVAPSNQYIAFSAIGNQTYGAAPLTLSATATSGLTPVFSVVSGPATVNGTMLIITGAGTVVVAADQAGSANYLAAAQVTQSITVAPSNQYIAFTAIGNQTYGAAPLTLSATATSGLTPTFSVISGPATVNGTMLTITGAGTVVVAADQAGDANYLAATQVTQSITVASSNQYIAFSAIGNQTYGVAPLTLSATATSGLTPAFSVISGPATVSGTTLTITGTGTVVVAADQTGNANYVSAAQVTQSITVVASTQTITFPAIGNQTYGVAPLTLSATATSGLAPTFSVISGPATVSGTTLTITGAGTVVVAADQAGDANYLVATQETQSITVAANTQTIIFPVIGNQTYGVAPLTLSATATSGLAPTFSVISGPATVSGTTLTITGAGTVVVAADQTGNANYVSAPQVTQSITVAASTQTITFSAIGNQTYGVAPLTLSATATSGLAPTFSVISGPVLLSGNTLTITSVGTIVVAANQSGNGNYQAAPTVNQTITVALPSNAVSLKGSDAGGTTSLTGATNWTNGLAPSGLNDYFASYVLRTPATSAGAITFAGKSLTMLNGGALVFKGSNVITINKLILNGGSIRNWYTGSNPDWAKLAGTITLAGNADIRCSSGNNETMEILAPIASGSATSSLTIMVEGAYVNTRVLLSAVNTYSGKTVIASSTLALSGTGSINNSASISIAAGATFDVSQKSSYVLSSATSLIASGAASPAIIKGGTTVNLGSQPINLTFAPTTFTGDITHPALTISAGTLSLADNPIAITITNASGTALGVGTYRLIQQASGNVGGSVTGSPLTVTGSGVASSCTASLAINAGNVDLVVTMPAAQSVSN